MEEITNTNLASLSSFGSGGNADYLFKVNNVDSLKDSMNELGQNIWVLGQGTNCLISDHGLPGCVLIMANRKVKVTKATSDTAIIQAEAGTNWDQLVQKVIEQGLWGIELMSGIPGTVGAAVVGNIAAYGQAVSDSLENITVLNPKLGKIETLNVADINPEYRKTDFLDKKNDLIILSAQFKLTSNQTKVLEYHSALQVMDELQYDKTNLNEVRKTIIETRRRAGSLLDVNSKTAGSFFKNPLVSPEQAENILKHEEVNSKSSTQLVQQNKLHGGSEHRVSAAHVLLAAGFSRGQRWDDVRLHPDHVLKIENIGNATSQEIYNVAQEIIATVKEKLNVDLEPEVRFLGKFS